MIYSFPDLLIAKVNLKTAQITLRGKPSAKAHFSSKILQGGGAKPFTGGLCTPSHYTGCLGFLTFLAAYYIS